MSISRLPDWEEAVYKCIFSVMPDLIRHPDVVPTKVGNHLKDWSRFSPWIPAFAGMTVLIEGGIHGQALIS